VISTSGFSIAIDCSLGLHLHNAYLRNQRGNVELNTEKGQVFFKVGESLGSLTVIRSRGLDNKD
jgi:hypothetical protein